MLVRECSKLLVLNDKRCNRYCFNNRSIRQVSVPEFPSVKTFTYTTIASKRYFIHYRLVSEPFPIQSDCFWNPKQVVSQPFEPILVWEFLKLLVLKNMRCNSHWFNKHSVLNVFGSSRVKLKSFLNSNIFNFESYCIQPPFGPKVISFRSFWNKNYDPLINSDLRFEKKSSLSFVWIPRFSISNCSSLFLPTSFFFQLQAHHSSSYRSWVFYSSNDLHATIRTRAFIFNLEGILNCDKVTYVLLAHATHNVSSYNTNKMYECTFEAREREIKVGWREKYCEFTMRAYSPWQVCSYVIGSSGQCTS